MSSPLGFINSTLLWSHPMADEAFSLDDLAMAAMATAPQEETEYVEAIQEDVAWICQAPRGYSRDSGRVGLSLANLWWVRYGLWGQG